MRAEVGLGPAFAPEVCDSLRAKVLIQSFQD